MLNCIIHRLLSNTIEMDGIDGIVNKDRPVIFKTARSQ